MGDFDSEVVSRRRGHLRNARSCSDMQAQASAAGTVISAVMFGALALRHPALSAADCESAICAGGKGAEASLKGVCAGSTPRPDRHRGDRDACAKEAPERI